MKQRPLALALAALAALPAASYALRHADAQPRTTAPRRRPPTRPQVTSPPDASAPGDAGLSTAHVVQRDARITGRTRGGSLCVAQRGCAAPQAVPPVPDGVHGDALDQVWSRRLELSGHRVSVQGALVASAGCTEMACVSGGCCNLCQGALMLRGDGRQSLALGAADDPRFACRGDDSGLCCGTEVPGAPVIVVGTLAAIPGSGGNYRIESPVIYRAR